jgi:hypothetical protein
MEYSEESFLKLDLTNNVSAGISHHISNYNTIIKYCYENKLKLIKPIFNLSSTHNNGKEINSDLSIYYDLDNISINNEKFKLYDESSLINKDIIIVKFSTPLLRVINPFNTIKHNYSINIPYNQSVIQIASDIVKKIGSKFMCIHVRRGDRITSKQIDIDTQPPNIISIIEKYNPYTVVYIMTNKIDELKELRNIKERRIYFFDDFEELKSINDNYYLFSIENIIMNLADVRCSTFNTSDKKYDCYLTNTKGFQ